MSSVKRIEPTSEEFRKLQQTLQEEDVKKLKTQVITAVVMGIPDDGIIQYKVHK